ncbi:YihY/virulence factor BrkB family protein (plasmid) [Ensifer adhaerens]|uniref:YihY/virulence factor BrkB family protein n=1 Tax=Ensifer adhaerens TaxID=106592 RepID=UPI001CC0B1F0|nr:YihY/virulence factor BrkB family protein [Ensifer adhaerens]MBZ7927630.1 YihY/virulence factor BrkB family protein [Ensifer adhaerens]UAX98444.1 YihY/virulence factor BrkB family protein [Ensifer adhaerens]UAY05824.1 YihY/virulence factor BrkB family protein [Ensifer adhaerens]UAY13201.1 YihY/virulence factor BrkB family protein [Ensifer adhaerens]
MHELKEILFRVASQVSEDKVTLVAAGVTFYVLLAVFPALTSLVSIYGLVSDPSAIGGQLANLSDVLPSQSLQLVSQQLESLVSQKASSLSFGFIAGLLVALWSARNGVASLFEAINIAYDETEERSFIRLTLLSLFFTLAGLVFLALLIALIAVMPAILATLYLDAWVEGLAKFLRWPLLLLLVGVGITLIYRYGPDREPQKSRWFTWGAAIATICWLPVSLLFSFYVDNFADYNATYGTMGALIGFMLWIWVSTIIILVGAELNAELEQTTSPRSPGDEKD